MSERAVLSAVAKKREKKERKNRIGTNRKSESFEIPELLMGIYFLERGRLARTWFAGVSPASLQTRRPRSKVGIGPTKKRLSVNLFS